MTDLLAEGDKVAVVGLPAVFMMERERLIMKSIGSLLWSGRR